MGSWIITLLIISTLLACWVFSFLVRLVSEFIARKRERLKAERNTRSIFYALSAMVIASVGSVASAWFALDLALSAGDRVDRGEFVLAVSFGLVAFAMMLAIWMAVGDRARGRLRCPRCWYNMEGIDAPHCPECGKQIVSQRQLRKARRARWPIGLIVSFLGIASYGMVSAKYVDSSGDYFALVPTWVLMAGWEHLPEDWIIYDYSPLEATLDVRLYENWWGSGDDDLLWVSDQRARRFGRRLCAELLASAEARSDARRIELISMLNDRLTIDQYLNEATDDYVTEWVGSPVESAALLRISAADLLAALLADQPDQAQLRLLEASSHWYWESNTTYGIATEWMMNEAMFGPGMDESSLDGVDSWDRWDLRQEIASETLRTMKHEALAPLQGDLDRDELALILISTDETRSELAQRLMFDSGVIDNHFGHYLRTDMPDETIDLDDRSIGMMMAYTEMSPESRGDVNQALTTMLGSDRDQSRKHAASIVSRLQRLRLEETEEFQRLVEFSIDSALGDYSPVHPGRVWSMHELALQLLVHQDDSEARLFPLVLETLLDEPNKSPYLNLSDDPFEDLHLVALWVEHFAQLTDSTDPDVRGWLIENLPVQVGTEHDDLLDSIAVDFLSSPEEHERELAEEKLRLRLADHLIGPGRDQDDDSWDDQW
jgi:hypothetical protein